MPRYEFVAPAPDHEAVNYPTLPTRTSYERRPIMPEINQHPVGVSLLFSVATFVLFASFIGAAGYEWRWLWVSGFFASGVFIVSLLWRLQVQDEQCVMERETTVTQADPIRATVTEGARGETVRRGNFVMSREYWTRLYDAFSDGRPLTRDGVVKARGMNRDLYHGDGAAWQQTLSEFRRLGLIDSENRMTDVWRLFHEDIVLAVPVRPFVRKNSANEVGNAGGVGGLP